MTPPPLSFTVAGQPIPQGSHRVIGSRVIPDARLTAWRTQVTRAAWDAITAADWQAPHDGPACLEMTFILPKPKRPRWQVPAVKPDLDKLLRAVGDALSPRDPALRILADDSRIVHTIATKGYGDTPGALITLTPLDLP